MNATDVELTMADLAQRWGVKLRTVHRYRAADRDALLPPPDRMVGRTPVWRLSTIERHEDATGRHVDQPRKE